MALSGLEIYKLLPKTNCRKCGYPTCLAFAMALAKKQVALEKCPDIDSTVKDKLEAAALPPIRLVTLGEGENKIDIGKETVLFRHEEKFHHPTAIGFIIEDSISDDELNKNLEHIKQLSFERVGQLIKVNLIAIKQTKDASNFADKVKKVSGVSDLGLVLIANDRDSLKQALEICAKKKPLIYCSQEGKEEGIADIAKNFNVPMVVSGDDIEKIDAITQKVTAKGVEDIVLNINSKSIAQQLEGFTFARRLALRKSRRSVGFPTISIIEENDVFHEMLRAGVGIAKYASIVLIKSIESWQTLALLTLRQNIFTDPQKPLQVEPKMYAIGHTTDQSPVLVTTNFSLSYYTVLGEVEASKIPSFIVSVDTEGMSVLTAWAAEKFTPESISASLEKFEAKKSIAHNRLIIPGYVSVISGELEDKSGWEIVVGPKEAAGIPSFLKKL